MNKQMGNKRKQAAEWIYQYLVCTRIYFVNFIGFV